MLDYGFTEYLQLFDPDRLRPVIRVGSFTLLLFLALNAGLTGLSAFTPAWLPKQFFGVDFVEDNRRRAVAAAAQYRQGIVDRTEPLVAILGLSSASEGIILKELFDSTGGEYRFLGLCGAGRNLEEISRYAQPLLETNLKPNLVVFAMNPFHLIDGYTYDNRTKIEILGLWFLLHRADIRHVVDLALFDARTMMFRFFDVRIEDALPDPWREMMKIGLPETVSRMALDEKIRQYGERSYYDPAAYLNSEKQITTLIKLVKEFRERRGKIMIVLMPEYSALKERVPREGLELLRAGLDRGFGESTLAVFNLRATIDDGEFVDISHLNTRGRTTFSRLLAEMIEKNVPQQPPLTSQLDDSEN